MKTTLTALIIALAFAAFATEDNPNIKDFPGVAGIKFGTKIEKGIQLEKQSKSRMTDTFYLKRRNEDADILPYYKIKEIEKQDTPVGFSTCYVMTTQSGYIHTILLQSDASFSDDKLKDASELAKNLMEYYAGKYGEWTYKDNQKHPQKVWFSPGSIFEKRGCDIEKKIGNERIVIYPLVIPSSRDITTKKGLIKPNNLNKVFIAFTDPVTFNQGKTEASSAVNFDRPPEKK